MVDLYRYFPTWSCWKALRCIRYMGIFLHKNGHSRSSNSLHTLLQHYHLPSYCVRMWQRVDSIYLMLMSSYNSTRQLIQRGLATVLGGPLAPAGKAKHSSCYARDEKPNTLVCTVSTMSPRSRHRSMGNYRRFPRSTKDTVEGTGVYSGSGHCGWSWSFRQSADPGSSGARTHPSYASHCSNGPRPP